MRSFQKVRDGRSKFSTFSDTLINFHHVLPSRAISFFTASLSALTLAAPWPAAAITPANTVRNVSTRVAVGTGDNVAIAGFIITGTQPKKVLIRGTGPTLARYGVATPLADPLLELHDVSFTIATNNDWQTTQVGGIIQSSQVSAIQNSKLAPASPRESAIMATLQPGTYTAIMRGANGTTGDGLVEVYDVDTTSSSNLINISTRGFVGTGNNVMIGGIIVVTQATKVTIRALGASLAQYGVSRVLADPQLELHNAAGAIIASNDNWQTTKIGGLITSSQAVALQSSGYAPASPYESAMTVTLPPGNYTAILRGKNNTTGIGLVEVYTTDTPPNTDLFLHVVMGVPPYVVDYDSNGSEPVSLIGHDSHTHEFGRHLTSWTWTEGSTVLGRAADIVHSFAVGTHTVKLAIADDNSPPRMLSDQATFTVSGINAVAGILTSYYQATTVPVSRLIDSLPSSPNFKEVRAAPRIDNVAGTIGGSGLNSNVVAVMAGNFHVATAATYRFTLVGGSATRFFINGSAVDGAIVLQPGTYAIEARFAIDNPSLLPAQILASVNGAAAAAIAPSAITHDETSLKPFINSMPTSGSYQGGETIVMAGLGFFPTGSVTVQFGGTTLTQPNLTVTPSSIQFLSPPGSGTVAVSVRTPNGASNSISYTYTQAAPISFAAPATVATTTAPTQAAWGPDGRLYVGSDRGTITIYTFNDDYAVTNTQAVNTVAALANKSILGLAFNPLDLPSPVKLYVGHSELFANGGGPFSGTSSYNGQVSVLTGPSFNAAQPLITGLPVSNHDHAVNGMTFDNNGDLLLANGGNTNAGIPSANMGTLPESPLSGAILKAPFSKGNFNGRISYVETATGRANNDQVFGDRVDVTPGVDVSVYVPGLRNDWDIVLTTCNILYGSDNGADPTFGFSSTSATTQGPAPDAPDEINHLVEGHYYGHPNRNRGRYDTRQNVYHLPTDAETFSAYNGAPMGTIQSSSNGIEEYRATTFGSQMRGNLLVQKWQGILYRAVLAADGRSVQSLTTLANPLGLDVVAGPGGAILSIDYSHNKIVVLKPNDSGAATGMVAYDIFPWRARADGAATFTIGGAGFGSAAATTVKIGGVSAAVTSVSPTRIKGIIPAKSAPSAQLLDVVVQSAGRTSTISQAFRYMQGSSKGTGLWTSGPNLPAAVGEVAAGVVNGVLYVVGEDTNLTMAYDLKAGSWRSNLAQRPRLGNHHAAEVINGKLYLFGGFGGGSEGQVQIYNPATNSWTLGTPAPYATGSASTALINGKVYMVGGIVGSSTVTTAAVYNPATDTWSSIASMPAGVNHAAASTDGQKLYVFGGRAGANVPSIGFNYVQIYDPAINAWTTSFQSGSTIPPLPQARGGMGKAVFYGNEFYIMGGETTSAGTGQVAGNVYNRVDVYNPVSKTWRLDAPMLTARHGIFPVSADNKIFVAGGGVQASHSSSAVFEIFSR